MNTVRTLVLLLTLTLSYRHSLAASAGWVVFWGDNSAGRASGNPELVSAGYSSGLVVIEGKALHDAVTISAARNHSLALKLDGTVVGWGWNSIGQATGFVSSGPAITTGPVVIAGQGLTNVTAIATGISASIALRNDGTVVEWGDNQNGRLAAPSGLRNVVAIAAGWNYHLAAKYDGAVVSWGGNIRGQAFPPHGLNNVVAVAASRGVAGNNLALKRNGTVIRWGYDDFVPASLSNVVAIAAGGGGFGGGHCLALKKDGTVAAWGTNNRGQASVPAGVDNVVAIAAGSEFSLALKNDGTVMAWGGGRSQVIRVPNGLTNVVAISAGEAYCLAITTNAAVAERFRR